MPDDFNFDDDTPRRNRRRDDDEPVSPTRKRGASDDRGDDNETPQSKRRRDDEEDDRPKRKRRRDDDEDEQPKKKSALPLILGLVGGLLLLCGGGCAGVYFLAIEPAAKKVREENDKQAAELKKAGEETTKPPATTPEPKPAARGVTADSVGKLKAGMTKAEVEKLLGPGTKASRADLDSTAQGIVGWNETVERWAPMVLLNLVFKWQTGADRVLVAYSSDPKSVNTVAGVLSKLDRVAAEPVELPDGGAAATPNPRGGGTPDAGEVSADVVAREEEADLNAATAKYKNHVIVAEGAVHKVFRRPDPADSPAEVVVRLAFKGKFQPDGVLAYCQCRPQDDEKGADLTVGQTVKIRGKPGVNLLNMVGCEITSTGPDPAVVVKLADLLAEFAKDGKAAAAKYIDKPLTLTDAVIEKKDEAKRFTLSNPVKGTGLVEADRPFDEHVDQKRFDAAKAGDRVTIKCVLSSVSFGTFHLKDCRLVSGAGSPTPGPGPEPVPKPGDGGDGSLVKAENVYGKLKGGERLEKVESFIGKGQKADATAVAAVVAKLKASDKEKKLWGDHAENGLVYRWDNNADQVLVAFAQPEAGGGLEAVLLTFDNTTSSIYDPQPILPVVEVKAEDLAAEFDRDVKAATTKYVDQILTVSGTVAEVSKNGHDVTMKGVTGGKRAVVVKVSMHFTEWKGSKGLKPGEVAKVHCAVRFVGPFSEGSGDRPSVVELHRGLLPK